MENGASIHISQTGSVMWWYTGKLIELLRNKGFFLMLIANWAANQPGMLDMVSKVREALKQYFRFIVTAAASEP